LQLFFRWRSASVLTLAASLFSAAPALAGTFTIDHGAGLVAYQAGTGEANDVALNAGQTMVRMQDDGVAAVGFNELGSSPVCSQMSGPNKYKCPLDGLTRAAIALGDGPDRFAGAATSFDTVVLAGTGAKDVTTGSGADQIFVRNGAPDNVTCGAGTDYVLADPAGDVISADCEQVSFEEPVSPPPGGSDPRDPVGPSTGDDDVAGRGSDSSNGGSSEPGTGALETALGLTLPFDAIAVPRPNRAVVPLRCAETAADGCRGDLIIELAPKRRATTDRVIAARGHYTAQSRRRRRIGRRSFRLAAGESVKLPVRIVLRGHYSRVSSRNRRRRASLKVVHRDAADKVIGVQTRSVTLQLQKRKWSRHRRGR